MYDLLVKYLPSFLFKKDGSPGISDNLNAILRTIANSLDEFHNGVLALKDCYYASKGLKLSLNEWRIFYRGDESDTVLQDRYNRRLEILRARGTATGILADIEMLTGTEISAELGDPSKMMVVGQIVVDDPICILDAKKLIILKETGKLLMEDGSGIELEDNSGRLLLETSGPGLPKYLPTIRREIVPFDTEIITEFS